VANAKKTLTTAYPKATITLDIAEDEEHQSNKVVCKVQTNGMIHEQEINHELVGSADFRELQKLAPSAIGLGRAPYKLKAKDIQKELPGSAELVREILEIGKHGLGLQRYKGLGEMNPDPATGRTTMNPETRTPDASQAGRHRRSGRHLLDPHGRRSGAAPRLHPAARARSQKSGCIAKKLSALSLQQKEESFKS